MSVDSTKLPEGFEVKHDGGGHPMDNHVYHRGRWLASFAEESDADVFVQAKATIQSEDTTTLRLEAEEWLTQRAIGAKRKTHCEPCGDTVVAAYIAGAQRTQQAKGRDHTGEEIEAALRRFCSGPYGYRYGQFVTAAHGEALHMMRRALEPWNYE
jgi:hypothetical protein